MPTTCARLSPPAGRLPTLLAILLFLTVPLGAALLAHHVDAYDAGETRAGRPLAPSTGVWFAAVVTDPQADRGGTESITTTDEAVVLWNAGPTDIDLTGWSLVMADGTDATEPLDGILATGAVRAVVNPAGTMNNDVTLRLLDASGTEADAVMLGAGGVPDGNADYVADEVVHLAGPWAATRGPWTHSGWPLGAFWVETVARNGTTNPPMSPAWHAGQNVSWDLTVHVAPGIDADAVLANATLRYDDGAEAAVVAVNGPGPAGTWQVTTASAAPPITDTAAFVLDVADHEDPDRFLDDTPLRVVRDATAATVAEDAVVATADGQVHWFPPVADPESGVADITVWFTEGTGDNATTTPGDGCLPLEAPGAGCAVTDPENTTAWFALTNGAGTNITVDRPLVVDDTPPVVPAITFEEHVPPRLVWTTTAEPLVGLVVEVADDVTGVWRQANVTLGPTDTTWDDDAWVPGEPRAYRLRATDRAGHTTNGTWTALPAHKVPVQSTPAIDDTTAAAFVADGAVVVEVAFDRAMDAAPRLVLEGGGPTPFWSEAEGALRPDARSAAYGLTTDTALPPAGEGTWRLVGGQGSDGAPVTDPALPASWDAAAPEVQVDGVSDGWVAKARHVVTLTAQDSGDDSPRLRLDTLPDGVRASGPRDEKRLTLRGEGLYEVRGHAEDDSGNRASFVVRIGLDATAPVTERLDTETTGTWDGDTPVVLRTEDPVSGVNASSLKVWVRNATTAVEATAVAWNDTTVTLVPSSAAPAGLGRPVEVHAAVADRAGNLADGRIGAALAATGVPARAADAGDGTRAFGMQGDGGGRAAPAAEGPSWTILRRPDANASSDGTDGTTTDASGWGGARTTEAPASTRVASGQEPSTSLSVWAFAGLLGSVGLGTMVVRRSRKTRGCPPEQVAVAKRQRRPHQKEQDRALERRDKEGGDPHP